MTAGPKQGDSIYHEALDPKRSAMIQTVLIALIGPVQQPLSHLPLEIKKNWHVFCREFRTILDNQKWQTTENFLLQSITRVPGEQK